VTRFLTLHGSHEARGVLFGGAGVSARAARERALRAWSPGARVHAIGERILVLFAHPERLRAEHAGGAIVVAAGDGLAAAPCGAVARGAIAIADRGAIAHHPLGAPIDPSEWIDIGSIRAAAVSPLGPEARPAIAPVAREAADVREALAIGEGAPAAAEAREAIVRALAGGAGDPGLALPPRPSWWSRVWSLFSSRAATASPSRAHGSSIARRPTWVDGVFARLRSLFSATGPSESAELAPPAPPSPFSAVFERLKAWAASLVLRTRLSQIVARRQAEYLARMLELFDRGDFREALRWAIPLGGDDGRSRPALGVPGPRDSLDIPLHRQGGAASIGGGPFLWALLHERYRRVLELLTAAGRVDEAAFVLAELLGDVAGAVSLLERHRRFREAARLAEARELDAAVVVRLWILAGEVRRAVTIAADRGAFESAIALLRRSHPEHARRLSLAWADRLASAGDFAGAVDAAAEVEGAERLVRGWIERAIEIGGPGGARALARRAELAPELAEDTRVRAIALLDEGSDEDGGVRRAFARALAGRSGPLVAAVARAAVRAVLRDAAAEPLESAGVPKLLEDLERVAGDGALRADRPPLSPRASFVRLSGRPGATVVRAAAGDCGSIAVRDAALLPRGRTALALGEAGVRVVGADGRTIAAIDAPAESLVVSDEGTRALALARRGTVYRVARVDLVERRAQAWWEPSLVAWADTFDGERWLVSERGVATVVDCLAYDWRASWRLVGETCVHVSHASEMAMTCLAEGKGLETWTYDAPAMRLKSRRAPPAPLSDMEVVAIAGGSARWAFGASKSRRAPRLARLDPWSCVDLEDGLPIAGALAVEGRSVAVACRVAPGARVDVVDAAGAAMRPFLHVLLDDATDVSLRLVEEILTIADDRGRVLAIDLRTGAKVRDLRIDA
jgi:hypothetical protein